MTRLRHTVTALLPLAALGVLSVLVLRGGVVDFMRRGLPPEEEISFERVSLSPGLIELRIVNGGADPVSIAQVTVDEAYWDFSIQPSPTLGQLGRATISIPYPWVQDEAHEISLLTSSGTTFSHGIEVATETRRTTPKLLAVFTAIGLYVGVIPVAIGLLWFFFLRDLRPQWMDFMLTLTAGLLVFLGADALEEAFETATHVVGAYQGSMLVVLATLGTFVALQGFAERQSQTRGECGARAAHLRVAFWVALGIGLHNLGEGLAIGAAYALGEAALGAFLIVGFMLHNTTEGLAIVAPIAKDQPGLGRLVLLGALAGAPTVAGAWIGGAAVSPVFGVLFLAVGAGAIGHVIAMLYRMFRTRQERVWTPVTAGGLVAGMLVMWATGLLVAV